MTTGYERDAYRDLSRIAKALERIADSLEGKGSEEEKGEA